MNLTIRGIGCLAVALACAVCGMAGAADLAIQSFNGTGQLTFNTLNTDTNYTYRVEWASTPAGPWNNSWDVLAAIQAPGSGIVTCSVPMCYRVVASLTPAAMVQIPAGTNSGIDQFGEYSLTVTAFLMDATEVTKALWDSVYTWAIMNGYEFDNAGSGKAWNHPVQMVNWYDCVKWCNARSQKEGRSPCYTLNGNVYKTGQSSPVCNFAAIGYRLPTMIEWEYAARGGLIGKRFPWGDLIDHGMANYFGYPVFPYDLGYEGLDTRFSIGDIPYTSPAGTFPANGYGLYDMAGNVWEWCWDSSDEYRYIHDGSWADDSEFACCGRRGNWNYPFNAGFGGFRPVRR